MIVRVAAQHDAHGIRLAVASYVVERLLNQAVYIDLGIKVEFKLIQACRNEVDIYAMVIRKILAVLVNRLDKPQFLQPGRT